MKDELYIEFLEKFRDEGANAIKYAWERNAENVLKECRERALLAGIRDPEPMKVALVVEISDYDSEHARAKVKVEKLFFKRTIKFCDTDFPEADIDLEQLEMDFTPGNAEQQCEEKPAETPRAAALLAAARELHCKAILPCLPGTIANWGRTVRHFDENGNERLILLPDGREMEVLRQAAEMGTLVVSTNGHLLLDSIDKLVHNNYSVRDFDDKGDDMGLWVWSRDGLELDGSCACLEDEQEFLEPGDGIIANVYPGMG